MKLLAVLSLTVVLGILSAGTLAGQTLTLEEAIAAARERNPKLAGQRQMAEAAASEVQVSRGAFLPTLSALGSYSQWTGDVFFARFIPPTPGQPPTTESPIGPFDSTRAALLTVSQTIYAGGGNGAKLRASRAEKTIAEHDLSQVDDDLVFEVTQAYLQVLLADKSLEVARNSAQRTEQNLDSVRRLREEQEALEVDVLAAQAQLASDRHSVLEAENDKKFALYSLNRLLGRDLASDLQPADILGQAQDLGAEEELLARAQANNPEILKAGLRVELAEAGIKGAGSNFRPKLSLDGLYSWLDNEMLFKGSYWGAGLNISIPFARELTEGAGAVAQARARKSAAESSLEETASAVALLARRALSDAREANQAIAVAEENRRYHQEKYRVTSSALAENLATFDELLDDHVDLSEAELALYQAQYQARLTEAEAQRLVGGP